MESTRIGARLKSDGVILYRIDAGFTLYGVAFYYGFVLPVALFFTPVAFGSSFGEFWAWMTADGDLWRSVLVVALWLLVPPLLIFWGFLRKVRWTIRGDYVFVKPARRPHTSWTHSDVDELIYAPTRLQIGAPWPGRFALREEKAGYGPGGKVLWETTVLSRQAIDEMIAVLNEAYVIAPMPFAGRRGISLRPVQFALRLRSRGPLYGEPEPSEIGPPPTRSTRPTGA